MKKPLTKLTCFAGGSLNATSLIGVKNHWLVSQTLSVCFAPFLFGREST
ncbi:MAG: hypothetical protein ACXW3W_13530 [Pyrinomonadaceae bacterium]